MAYNGLLVSPSFERLSLLTRTVYAQLLDQLVASSVGDPRGDVSLVSKTIRGRRYWYVQSRVGGKRVQKYLGPDSTDTERLARRWQAARAQAATRAELIAMARAGGAYVLPAVEARVMEPTRSSRA